MTPSLVVGHACSPPAMRRMRRRPPPRTRYANPPSDVQCGPDGDLHNAGDDRTMVEESTATQSESAFRARPGDWVVVHGHTVGEHERAGLILEVLGTPGHEHYRVRWDEEHESIFYPGSDAMIRREAP